MTLAIVQVMSESDKLNAVLLVGGIYLVLFLGFWGLVGFVFIKILKAIYRGFVRTRLDEQDRYYQQRSRNRP